MPTLIEMRLKATWTVRPDTRHLHGLACALFEGESADHLGQEKPFTIWPLSPAQGGASQEWTWRTAWLPDDLPPPARSPPTSCAVIPPDWWHDDGHSLHVAVWAAVLLSVAGLGYLYLEASSHDVRGWRRAWRPAAVAAFGYLHAAMVSVIGLRFLLPEFSPRPASPPYLSCWWHPPGCGPGALPPWLLLLLAAAWAFAAGVFFQIIWDDKPVTAPLAHVSWRRES